MENLEAQKEFNSVNEFRCTATDEDYQNLLSYINSLSHKTRDFKNGIYNFSYSSAVTLLKEKGLWENAQSAQRHEKKNENFIIEPSDTKPAAFTTRSFTVEDSILGRYDKLCEKYWQYSKKAILNKLLDEALNRYGY